MIKNLSHCYMTIVLCCTLAITNQTFAQEVLTKVNGGASWKTPSRTLQNTNASSTFTTAVWDQESDVLRISNGTLGNLKLYTTNVITTGMVLTVVNSLNSNFSLCCTNTYITLDGTTTSNFFPATSSTTLMFNGTTFIQIQ